MTRLQALGSIFLMILLTVYGQLILKWRISEAGIIPHGLGEKLLFILRLFLTPWVLSGFIAAFLASLAWMLALTRLPLSYAYPFTSLSFVLVFSLSVFFFHEPVTRTRIIGLVLIIGGIVISCQE